MPGRFSRSISGPLPSFDSTSRQAAKASNVLSVVVSAPRLTRVASHAPHGPWKPSRRTSLAWCGWKIELAVLLGFFGPAYLRLARHKRISARNAITTQKSGVVAHVRRRRTQRNCVTFLDQTGAKSVEAVIADSVAQRILPNVITKMNLPVMGRMASR